MHPKGPEPALSPTTALRASSAEGLRMPRSRGRWSPFRRDEPMKRGSAAIVLLMVLPLLACNSPFLGGITEEQVATFAAGTVAAINATRVAEPTTPAPSLTSEPPT